MGETTYLVVKTVRFLIDSTLKNPLVVSPAILATMVEGTNDDQTGDFGVAYFQTNSYFQGFLKGLRSQIEVIRNKQMIRVVFTLIDMSGFCFSAICAPPNAFYSIVKYSNSDSPARHRGDIIRTPKKK